MKATCPHCGKDIEVVSSGDLEKEFGLNQNKQQSLRDAGKMPGAWLAYPNRNIYLRSDVEQSLSDDMRQQAERTVESLRKSVENLPPEMQDEVFNMLKKLGNGKT